MIIQRIICDVCGTEVAGDSTYAVVTDMCGVNYAANSGELVRRLAPMHCHWHCVDNLTRKISEANLRGGRE